MNNDVSDYDLFSYDYSQYWTKRRYEDLAEKHLLNKMFQQKSGDWFIDIGGSYGRLTSTYDKKYKNPVILDYSAKTLRNNYEVLKNKYPNINLIAANAYKMPLKDNVFDGGLMVRVLHHIENPEGYLKEVRRIMKPKSTYIQEFANKVHLKAILRALLKGNFKIFSKEIYEQPSISVTEGTGDNIEGIFLNYHPGHVKELLEQNNFTLKKKTGCSFLRIPFLKKLFNDQILLFFEKIMQATLSWSNISPSIFLETEVKKKSSDIEKFETLEDILACPECKGSLHINSDIATCEKCKKVYEKKDNVWDFRVL